MKSPKSDTIRARGHQPQGDKSPDSTSRLSLENKGGGRKSDGEALKSWVCSWGIAVASIVVLTYISIGPLGFGYDAQRDVELRHITEQAGAGLGLGKYNQAGSLIRRNPHGGQAGQGRVMGAGISSLWSKSRKAEDEDSSSYEDSDTIDEEDEDSGKKAEAEDDPDEDDDAARAAEAEENGESGAQKIKWGNPQNDPNKKDDGEVRKAGTLPRRLRRSKDQINTTVTLDADAVLDALVLPGTDKWRRVSRGRLVVNQVDPRHKGLRNTPLDFLPQKDFGKRYKTCAVVGNGGVLLSTRYGASIDKHDAIFRFNNGRTTGYEDYVGKRTSFRLLNNNWVRIWRRARPAGSTEQSILLFSNQGASQLEAISRRYPHTNVLLISPEFAMMARGMYQHAYRVMRSSGYLTVRGRNSAPSGIEGIFFALAVCDRVHLYGFGVDADPSIPYHYHDKHLAVDSAHSFNFQAEFLKVMATGGKHLALCVPGHELKECRM